MKRILIGSIYHESNSFNPIITKDDDFTVFYNEHILSNLRKNDSLTGIVETLNNYELLPTVSARAIPNGEVDYEFYKKIKRHILEMIDLYEKQGPIDGVCLALHGSMRIVEIGDAEGDLLEAIRNRLPDVPIHAALDMHTTMTDKMFDHTDSLVGYKCAPHTDCYETGVHAANMLMDHLKGCEFHMSWVKIPALIAGEQSETSVEPMISLMDGLRALEKEEGIHAASYLMGFPWSDNQDNQISVCVVGNNIEEVNGKAIDLAEVFWSNINAFQFHTETYEMEQSIDVAMNYIKKNITPVYLSDSGDNPTAGSTGDGTNFIRKLMANSNIRKLKSPVIYGGIYDPEATLACKNHVGDEIEITFGGKYNPLFEPITVVVKVMSYIKDWHIGGYFKSDVALVRFNNIDLVLNEKHIGYIVPDLFTDLGRDPGDAQLVICKLGYLTAPQRRVAKRSVMALTDGSTNENIKSLNYQKLKRPIYPLDQAIDYNPLKHIRTK